MPRHGTYRATIYEMVSKGTFPKQVRLSPRAVGWIKSEILKWQQARIAERDGAKRINSSRPSEAA